MQDAARKINPKLLGQLGVLMLLTLGVIVLDYRSLTGGVSLSKLEVVQSHHLPIKELSGLAFAKSTSGTDEFVAIGDRNATLISLKLDPKGQATTESTDLSPLIVGSSSICREGLVGPCKKINRRFSSDWEAVAIDAQGHLFLVQEFSSSVVVIDQSRTKVLARINLDFEQSLTKGSKKRAENADTLGEGILLLKNGHIVIARERYPASLVEFGPVGEAPMGISKDTVLGSGEVFKMDVLKKDYAPLHSWKRPLRSKCDISDLAYNQKGKFFLLSDNCRRLEVFDSLGVDSVKIELKQGWIVPPIIKHPEAIAFDSSHRMMLGSDIKSRKPNLFVLDERK